MSRQTKLLIKRAAEVLIKAGAREVYLFGSYARGMVDAGSDVDLAITGLQPSLFFRAMGQARRILRQPVDLVDLDESNPFTDFLKKSGELKRVG